MFLSKYAKVYSKLKEMYMGAVLACSITFLNLKFESDFFETKIIIIITLYVDNSNSDKLEF